jgi:hypothetical protein
MMDARLFLDEVRTKMPGNAKAVVLWLEPGSPVLHAAQANVSVADIGRMVEALKYSSLPPIN